MYFFPSSDASPRSLLLNESTAEDIRYELGEPIGIHYKDDDRMAIHGSNSQTLPPNSCTFFARLMIQTLIGRQIL